MQQYALLTFLIVILLSLSNVACKHEPIFNGDPDPADTTGNPVDTTGGSTGSGVPCNPDSAYFQNQILPILISNCTEAGCHNDADHEEGVVLTSYPKLMSTVEHVTDNNWDENKLMRVLLENDPDDRMPYGKPPLPQAQIDLIAEWIQQGARNNGCNENYGACETTDVKYSAFVQPLIQAKCQGCHSGAAPQGGTNLSTYANVKSLAINGKLYAAVTRTVNWMPNGGARLDDCSLAKLKAWIDAGALQN